MKKKLILRSGTALMSALLLLQNPMFVPEKAVYAEEAVDKFEIDENGVLITYYGNSSVIVVPDNATSIGNSAFSNRKNLSSIELSNVTSIGSQAFMGCSSLSSIELPNVTDIEDSTFRDCSGLSSIELSNVTKIGNSAFMGCSSLSSIELPNVISIEDHAFNGCRSLNSINLPNVTNIGNGAFAHCSSLKSIKLPNVTSIGSGAFAICRALTIYAPEGSYAQTYALQNNIPFKVLSDTDTPDVPDTPDTPATDNTYFVDVTQNTTVSASDFETILKENETKDIVIKSNGEITFTFAKETMQAADGKDSYNFAAGVTTEYDSAMPSYISKDNFAAKIDFAYSGKLPAKAKIRIPVGESYAGKTLYYYLINTDNTYTFIQSAEVNSEGF